MTKEEQMDLTFKCPKCKAAIRLTDAMAAPLLESARAQFEAERESIAAAAKEEAEANIATLQAKLAKSQAEQARLLFKEAQLDDARREMDLTIARRVRSQTDDIRAAASKSASEEYALQVVERDTQIAAMTRQIDELKQRATQGSQQLQGEAQELLLEQILCQRFPMDAFEPVGKGVQGADVIQRVISPSGLHVGTILWESKRTKNWNDAWLPKLREDVRAAKADVALLITQTMPRTKDGAPITTFDLIDGVWVTSWSCYIPVAIMLRQSLLDLFSARSAIQGQQSKAELVYAYLTGPQFKHRVSAIVEKFSELAGDLASERRTMTRLWAKREAQIQGALDAAAGMYGDLQGIAGSNMAEVEGLQLRLEE